MALYFYRPSFRAGVMIIKDQDTAGNPIKHMVKSEQNGKEADFVVDEAFVAAQYPEWFTNQGEFQAKKAARKKAKKEKKTFVKS